ncbi:MAG TPA: DNA polymerase/3'-5' exonuclease PolX [Candidatus Binatia bacterium]|nr:DNA polymerase/3'-5' exonuclease PolX [Candidatus Binatia bacterium]
MRNADLARYFRDLAAYLEMDDVPFKPRAYEKAAQAIESHDRPLAEIYRTGGEKALCELPGIGKSMAEKLAELITTGSCALHARYHRRIPVDLAGLTAIEGVGPKAVKALYEQLGVRTVGDLAAAARAGKVRTLPHFGEKSEQRILKALAAARASEGRRPLYVVLPVVEELAAALGRIAGVGQVAIAGSIRRRRETIGDADLLAVARGAAAVTRAFVALPGVERVLGRGDTKASVKLAGGLQVDLRVVPVESFGAALLYFTGSKAHNVALRQVAIKRGLKLNEYGLFRGERRVAGRTEAEIYAYLDLAWIPPELREDQGEIEAAQARTLPRLIEPGDLRGDLQTQTDWTDGADSIEAMARAAAALGLEYIAITDHTKSLAMTGGSDAAKLRRQMREIARLNATLDGLRILAGAEVNIDRDGGLDIDDATLARLDVVGIAVHSHFHLPRAEQTRRLVRAMENPHADILFHPTGRVLGKREPYDVDVDALIAAAKRTGTVLELDAYPERLDLKDEHLRKAAAAGVPLVIDSDAHSTKHLPFPRQWGVDQARRGWVTAKDVLNTRPLAEFLAGLKGAGSAAPPRRARR